MEKNVIISMSVEEFQNIISDCVNKCLADKYKQAQIDSTIYTTKDMAKMFKVSTKTIQNWRDGRLIGYSKINNSIFYQQHQINRLLEKHSVKPMK